MRMQSMEKELESQKHRGLKARSEVLETRAVVTQVAQAVERLRQKVSLAAWKAPPTPRSRRSVPSQIGTAIQTPQRCGWWPHWWQVVMHHRQCLCTSACTWEETVREWLDPDKNGKQLKGEAAMRRLLRALRVVTPPDKIVFANTEELPRIGNWRPLALVVMGGGHQAGIGRSGTWASCAQP